MTTTPKPKLQDGDQLEADLSILRSHGTGGAYNRVKGHIMALMAMLTATKNSQKRNNNAAT